MQLKGREAVRALAGKILQAGKIEVGETWTQERGWLCYMKAGSGLLTVAPRQMRRLADQYERSDGRKLGLGEIIDQMQALAETVKRKNAAKVVPPEALRFMPPTGSA